MDKSRQKFEEWRSKNKSSTINLFDVWQASRESLVNSLPESINCPTAPELIWLQVDPEPEEENKPVYPVTVNLYSDDVTWCADRVHSTDTLYIRADLIQK